MAKKNSEYWEKRIANNTWTAYNNAESRNRALLELYQDASKNVRDELYAIGERYSKEGVLSRTEMYRKNRLKKLQARHGELVEELGKDTMRTSMANMQEAYKEVYSHCSAELGVDFVVPNKQSMNALLKEPWRGDNFESRLWGKENMQKLVRTLNAEVTYGLQTGKTVTDMAIALNRVMQKGFDAAHRLVRTETMHYLNNGALQSYKDAGIEWVQVWAAQDERTCEVCGSYHEKYYRINECPMLPFHPNCRCTIIPVTDSDEIARLKAKEPALRTGRAAKAAENNTGKKVYFNENNDYSIKISGYSEEVLQSFSGHARKVAEKGSADGMEHLYLIDTNTGKEEYYEMGIEGEVGDEEFWKFIREHKSGKYAFIHNHNTDGIFSETDLRTLLQNECIDPMIAVRNDAIIYVAERGEKVPNTGFYDDLYQDELKMLNKDVQSGKILPSERSLKREEIIVNGLIRDYTKAGRLIELDGRK